MERMRLKGTILTMNQFRQRYYSHVYTHIYNHTITPTARFRLSPPFSLSSPYSSPLQSFSSISIDLARSASLDPRQPKQEPPPTVANLARESSSSTSGDQSSRFGGLVRSLLVAIPLYWFFSDTVGGLSTVVGTSMQPTLNPNALVGEPMHGSKDIILVNRFDRNYYRGDVVELISPLHPTKRMVKRIVGIEGDWVTDQDKPEYIVRNMRQMRESASSWLETSFLRCSWSLTLLLDSS